MENPIKMDDLGVPLFLETSMWPKMRIHEHCVSMCLLYISWSEPIGKKNALGP